MLAERLLSCGRKEKEKNFYVDAFVFLLIPMHFYGYDLRYMLQNCVMFLPFKESK